MTAILMGIKPFGMASFYLKLFKKIFALIARLFLESCMRYRKQKETSFENIAKIFAEIYKITLTFKGFRGKMAPC